MNEKEEKAISRWFLNHVVERNTSSCGASLVSIKLNKEIYVNFLLNNDGEVSGVSTYIKEE